MTIIRRIVRTIFQFGADLFSSRWPDYSRLILVSDSPAWSIRHDMREISCLAEKLGVKTAPPWFAIHGQKQAVFMGSHFDLLLNKRWLDMNHRFGTAYFHGKPGQGVKEFDECFETLRQFHHSISRVQVSCKSMRNVVLRSGIDRSKVHLIPIGINPALFHPQTLMLKLEARKRFGIPVDAFVVGSFQKDGNGWGEGLEPKMIKGPDVFVESMRLLKQRVGSLFVLLSGPARGYVKNGLKGVSVPFLHCQMKDYADVGKLYHALDCYVIASREEGGPKSVLESMASGIPLISTRVGQAEDMIVQGVNGFLVDNEDAEAISAKVFEIFKRPEELQPLIEAGITTASENSYASQLPKWEKFFKGFID